MATADPTQRALSRYRAKRDFRHTPEPSGAPVSDEPPPAAQPPAGRGRSPAAAVRLAYVIQKHWASRLHYDFRLELDGVLLSWAVPKGPSLDPHDKRLALQVEDHPLDYAGFEGRIPAGHYGAGQVIVWDRGHWEPVGDPRAALAAGKLVFRLHGEKLGGLWELVRLSGSRDRPPDPPDGRANWFLFKKHDEWARSRDDFDVTLARPDSVVSAPNGAQTPPPTRQGAAQGDGAAERSSAGAPHPVVLPASLQPQLATLADALPAGPDWTVEFKFDGYRLLARVEHGGARLFTRSGHDWTARLPALAAEVASLPVGDAWLDGELVALGADGLPDFNVLQNAFGRGGERAVRAPLVWYLFDAPYLQGQDLRALPLQARRERLQAVMVGAIGGAPGSHLRFSEALPGELTALWRQACASHLEGLMAKRADAPYVHGRTATWLKIKCHQRQEFVVLGYTESGRGEGGAAGGGPGGKRGVGGAGRGGFGSLLLGYHDAEGRLAYAGNVGTGWDEPTRRDLYRRLAAREVPRPPPGIEAPRRGRWTVRAEGIEHWVRPDLLVEVSFGEWTPDGRIRHASFQGVREDKPAREVRRETAMKITHPERVIDAGTGLTKRDLVHYYESVAEAMLPHLAGRPVSLVRAPEGVGGETFFQKHADAHLLPSARQLAAELWPGHPPLIEIHSVEALLEAAQMNVVEFHTWNAPVRHLDRPDRFILDLDPGEGVSWPQVQEAATLTRALLDELGLRCWLKTSGGKGLHVVVPCAARQPWDVVKDFSHRLVEHLARTLPSRFVVKSGPKNREGRIFPDYLRNGMGQTTVAAFSARVRPGLGVSMPVAWDELGDLKGSAQWTIRNARDRLSFLAAGAAGPAGGPSADPWADYWTCRQPLTAAMRRLSAA